MESKPRQPELIARTSKEDAHHVDAALHPAWLALIRYCRELRHGEIERLSIQDGLPVLAEHVRQKIKFTR
ncbi:MAG TPA: hypothetical protein VES20_14820 [Bryobacteraceae bacterium]|nr:hypothetical protein [Bryobacteraceae bacterium]